MMIGDEAAITKGDNDCGAERIRIKNAMRYLRENDDIYRSNERRNNTDARKRKRADNPETRIAEQAADTKRKAAKRLAKQVDNEEVRRLLQTAKDEEEKRIIREKKLLQRREDRRRRKLSRCEVIIEHLSKCSRPNAGICFPRKTDVLKLLSEVQILGSKFDSIRDLTCRGLFGQLVLVLDRFGTNNDVLMHVLLVIEAVLKFAPFYKEWIANVRVGALQCGLLCRLINIVKSSHSRLDAGLTERCTILIAGIVEGQPNLDIMFVERDMFLDILKSYHSQLHLRIAEYACLILFFMADCRCDYSEETCRLIYCVLRDISDGEFRRITASCAIKLVARLVVEDKNRHLLQSLGIQELLQPYADYACGFNCNRLYSMGAYMASHALTFLRTRIAN
jgi:hypothetical protein